MVKSTLNIQSVTATKSANIIINFFSSINRIDDYFRLRKIERVKNLPAAIPGFDLEDEIFQNYEMSPDDMNIDVTQTDNKTFDTTPGEQFRDFLYIDDFCKGVISLFDQSDHYSSVFNIASGKGITVRHVIETVIAVAGGGAAIFGGKPYRPGESMALFADISAIKKATGWHPETSLKDGLRFTIDAMKNGN